MPKRKSNIKIEDGKVIFSQEILDYFENLRTKENSIWIDKYFEVLSDPLNFDAKKFNIHHIIPATLFKDENHQTRNEMEYLADKIKENRIKLSYSNHIISHYYLWKIIPNNEDIRKPVYLMCGKINIKNLTENEIKKISIIQEECKKENQTDEEKRISDKNYRDSHKEQRKIQAQFNKEEKAKYDKIYRKINHDKLNKQKREWCIKNHDKLNKLQNERNNQQCYDPIKQDNCKLKALSTRKYRHPDLYKDINPLNCILKISS